MKEKPNKKEPKKELTYKRKAIEIARDHWENQKKKAVKERETFHGLQIIPKASYYDESHGHQPGENNWSGFGFDLHPQVSLIAAGAGGSPGRHFLCHLLRFRIPGG